MPAEIGNDILAAKQILLKGDLVSIPTETVYGLAGNAYNTEAVLKIFQVKNRPTFDPLIVHTHSIEQIKGFVDEVPKKALKLMEHFWPGPITFLLKKKTIIPDLVTSGSPLVAVRVPAHSIALKLLSSLDFPLAAPSANPFGYISPTNADHVFNQLGEKIPYILDGGPSLIGIESTIVGFDRDEVIVYRLGGVTVENLEKEVGKVKTKLVENSKPSSPGMLTSHYAPSKKVLNKVEEALKKYKSSEIGYLGFKNYNTHIPRTNQMILSIGGNLEEAAGNLFGALRQLDSFEVKVIVVEYVPERGLGRAINDRLRRASARMGEK